MRFVLTLAALAFMATPALADHHGDMEGKAQHKKAGLFQKADSNGDGDISKAEFVQYTSEKAQMRFDKIDTDNNGQLTKEEALTARSKMRRHMNKKIKKWKNNNDANNMGNQSQMRQRMQKMGNDG